MKITKLVFLCILLCFLQKGMSQSSILFENSFTEETAEVDKFSIYLDSIDKYLYRDVDLTSQALEECQRIIDQGTAISDSIIFK